MDESLLRRVGGMNARLPKELNRLLWCAWCVLLLCSLSALGLRQIGMSSLSTFLFVVGILTYGGARIYVRMQSLEMSQRGKAIQAYAIEHGFAFEESADPLKAFELFHSLNDFPLFRKYGKSATNNLEAAPEALVKPVFQFLGILPMTHIVRGEREGLRFVAFDYFTSENSSNRTNATRLTALMVHQTGMDLPPFQLRERKNDLMGMALNALGWGGIDVPDAPRFDEYYKLTGKGKESIRDAFRQGPAVAMAEDFETLKDYIIEGRGDDILVYKPGTLIPPKEYPAFIDVGCTVAAMFRQR